METDEHTVWLPEQSSCVRHMLRFIVCTPHSHLCSMVLHPYVLNSGLVWMGHCTHRTASEVAALASGRHMLAAEQAYRLVTPSCCPCASAQHCVGSGASTEAPAASM